MAVRLEKTFQEGRNLQDFLALLQVIRLVHRPGVRPPVTWVQHYIALAGRVLRRRTGSEDRRREKASREDRGLHQGNTLKKFASAIPVLPQWAEGRSSPRYVTRGSIQEERGWAYPHMGNFSCG